MPDVIIKGMEVPSGCRACKLNNDTICALINGCVYDETDGSTRRPDCPLRPAPEWIEFTTREPDADERELHPDWEYVLNCRLPDDGQRILVRVKYRTHEQVQMDEFYDDSEGCYLDSGYEIVSEVTHWMPLPEPPDGGDGE